MADKMIQNDTIREKMTKRQKRPFLPLYIVFIALLRVNLSSNLRDIILEWSLISLFKLTLINFTLFSQFKPRQAANQARLQPASAKAATCSQG